jgi:hypothetical protein
MLIRNQGLRWPFILFGLLLAGCGGGRTRVSAPEWDAAAATEHAMSEYDADGNQKLSREELKRCPGLLIAAKLFDGDGDGAISVDELKTKLAEMHEQQAALVEVSCSVTRGGKPLEGAIVTFVPEPFMGESFQPATGVTGPDGTAFPSVAENELPAELRGRVHGVHSGIFRVTVTHPQIAIPAKFNKRTELGWCFLPRNHETLHIDF